MADDWPRSRSYVIWTLVNWLGFLAAVGLLSWGTDNGRLSDTLIWAVVIVAAGTVGAQFVAAYRLIAQQDEFVRGITVKRGIAAAAVTLTAAVLWGLGPAVPAGAARALVGRLPAVLGRVRDGHAVH